MTPLLAWQTSISFRKVRAVRILVRYDLDLWSGVHSGRDTGTVLTASAEYVMLNGKSRPMSRISMWPNISANSLPISA